MNSLMCIGFFALGIVWLIKGSPFNAMSSFLICSVFSISSQLELNAVKKEKEEKERDMTEVYDNIITKIEDNVYGKDQ